MVTIYSRDYPDASGNLHTARRDVARAWKMDGATVTPDPGGSAPGPCAKVRVFCTLVHPDGRRWVGENVVRRPQPTCPRDTLGLASGTGYHHCVDTCGQVGHAEVLALLAAGSHAAGSTAYVENRDFVCYDCQAQLVAAGVRKFVLGAPPR